MQDSSTERVGRYQLLEPIGGGPNGSVSRAKVFGVAGFERQFAIKRFLPELAAASSSAQALSAAARSYGSLEHPRIARMSEFGVAQGQTFTAVELVAGLDVSRLVAEARLGGSGLASGGSLALISQAARAVGYAHGRGLSHLGLSPTNVIVTAEGDVKVTDFGILAATITAKPVETPRLAYRIGYLAPEQLVGEATSAATDVFVLGVIAYELVTGQRAFFGDSPLEIANKILSGPPADPPLPRPIVRVLSRCLARSQFERFPDARAFADALDAALRVAPVPGTRKDIGAQVKATLDRHAAMNEGNLSGVVALPSRPPPASLGPSSVLADLDLRKKPSFTDHDLELADAPEAVATTEFVRPDVEVPGPARLVGPSSRSNEDSASTVPDLKPQISTMPGLVAPPPIPVPHGVTQPMPPPIPMPGNASTMLGISSTKKPQIPSIKPKSPIPSIVPAALKPVGGVPSVLPPRPPTGAIPSLRQTQPGQGSVGPEVDDFGRPKRILVGPIPGLGAPGRPPSESGATRRAGTDLAIPVERRASSESDVETLAGDEISLERLAGDLGSDANDEETRPGVYGRAESDFSDLSEDPARDPVDPATTMPEAVFARPKPPLQPKHVISDDDPPTAPHDVLPEVHKRGGLQPFAAKRSFADREPTNTSPSIEIIREPGDSIDNLPVASDRQQPSTAPPFQRDLPTGEMAPDLVKDLKRASLEEDPLVELALEAHGRGAIEVMGGDQVDIPSLAAQRKPTQNPSATMFGVGKAGSDAARPTPPRAAPPARLPSPTPPSLVGPSLVAPSLVTPNSGLAMPGAQVPSTVQSLAPPPPPRVQPSFSLPSQKGQAKRRWPIALGALVVLGAGSGIAVWQVMQANEGAGGSVATGSGSGSSKSSSNVGSNVVVAPGSNAGKGSAVVAAGSNAGKGSAVVAAGSNVRSAAVVAAGSNVGSAAGSNAGSGAKPTPVASSDALQIASTPPGARVFIDGADQGVTPVKLAGSADRHTIALSAPGFELYVAEVDGHGAFAVPLKAITPNNGPAGIKVIKCKDKDRYYVSVDGKPTGMTCPTERIGTTVGPHTVEVYDLVTESRRKWDINVTDTRLSYRVKID